MSEDACRVCGHSSGNRVHRARAMFAGTLALRVATRAPAARLYPEGLGRLVRAPPAGWLSASQ